MKHSRCQDLAIGVVACLMMIRVDAFLAASSNGLSHAQRSYQITATSRRRAPYSTVTMRSTTRQSNGKGVPPAREEGKRRTPQEIAGESNNPATL
ncbi:unnamed protein product [Ectocarpus sp. 6 AP-2014]